MGGMTKAVETGMPSCASRNPRPGARRASTGARKSSWASTSYRPEKPEHVDILDVDNAKVAGQQIARLEQVRAGATPRNAPLRWKLPDDRSAESGGTGNLLAAVGRGDARAGDRGRDIGCAGKGVYTRHRAVDPQRDRVFTARPMTAMKGFAKRIKGEVDAFAAARDAGRACWWSRWARTVMTAAPR